MTGIVNCECSNGDGHGIAPNSKINEIPRFIHPQGRIGEINKSGHRAQVNGSPA